MQRESEREIGTERDREREILDMCESTGRETRERAIGRRRKGKQERQRDRQR